MASDFDPDAERSTRRAPAPWQLRADGYALLLRPSHVADAYRGEAHAGPLSCAIFADYAASPVGPYRELFFIPGAAMFGRRLLPTITKIYVSTQASIDNGRANWGIPKELASFTVEHRSARLDHLTMRVDTQIAVDLTVESVGPRLPFATWMLPAPLRTLGQRLDGRTYEVKPSASGRMQWARVKHAWADAALFPELSPASIVAAIKLSKVALTFPEAELG
jgi:hypothetical protein